MKAVRIIEWGGLLVIILLAAYLRLGSPGVVEYKRDEANLAQLALNMTDSGDIPLLGIGSSVGVPNAPWNVYVLSIPYMITSSPVVVTGFIGLLNVLAVIVTYMIARRYTNAYIALLVALLFAVNPWAVIFSRKIWAQNMLPLFVVLTVGVGFAGFVHGRRWGQWMHLPLLAITGQIHYGAFVMIPVTLSLLFVGRKKLTRAFWFSLVITGLVTLPYLIGLAEADLLTPQAIESALTTTQDAETADSSLKITSEAMRGAALMIAGTEIHSLAGAEMFLAYLDTVPDAYPLFNLMAWAVLLAAIWLVVRIWIRRDQRTSVDVTLLIWLIFPIIAYLVNWTPFFIHYLIPIFPSAFLVLGFAVYDGWTLLTEGRTMRHSVFAVGGVMVSAIVVLQVWLFIALIDFVETHPTPGGFGTPLHYLMDVREEILQTEASQVIGAFAGQAIGIDDEPTVWNTLLHDVSQVRFVDGGTQVYPMDDAIYLTSDCNHSMVEQRFNLRGDGCYGLGEVGTLSLENYTQLDPQPSFANGVEIVAYRYAVCLSLVWRITQPTDRDYMFAVPFFDDSGERIGNADGLSWFGRYWLPGDIVVREFCPAVLDGEPVEVGVGMYTFDGTNFDNVELVDRDGQLLFLPLDQ